MFELEGISFRDKTRPFIIIIIIITQFLTRHMSVKVWRNRRRDQFMHCSLFSRRRML